jgi:hypothetical protein
MAKLGLVVVVLIVVLALASLAKVDRRNMPVNPAESIEAQTQMPQSVAAIFHRACRDCHTELTNWPWYSNIAPFHWLMAADVYGAREHMNLSTWGRYTSEQQNERLIAICEMVAGDKMPLWYYKPLHYPDAWLSESNKKAVCDWAKSQVMSNYRRTTGEGAVPGKNPPEAFLTERGSDVDSMNNASVQGK